MENQNFNYIYKIILIGDSGVGKTNIAARFIDDKFLHDSRTTIGIDFKIKTLNIDGDDIKIQIWDSAGQERFRCITRSYYQHAGGTIIVFDLTRYDTFTNIKKWIKDIENNADNPENMEILIVGNKADLVNERQVQIQDIKELRRDYNFEYIETSAKDGLNIDEAFINLVSRAHKRGLHLYSNRYDETADIVIIRDDGISQKTGCSCAIL